MGRKISVDSSTLANKGLEVIEASRLFGVAPDMIDVLIHPQGVIHSMVEFRDNAVIAQMGAPDMRGPIQYALTYPNRYESLPKPVDFCGAGGLTFEKPDGGNFPCLPLAYDALRAGGTMPAVYNAANEAAVELFFRGAAGFSDIPRLISAAMERHAAADDMDIGNVYAADGEAREIVGLLARRR
jgi:1-deoxy-D-xylulose-5-phosphate reductoisomerase